ncbi:unnamed protein product [Mucor hiemalis]
MSLKPVLFMINEFATSSSSAKSALMGSNEVTKLIKSNIIPINDVNVLQAIPRLSKLNEEETSYQNKVILRFKYLIEQLPKESFDAKKLELTSRLVQPLLQPLFENEEEGLYLRWTDTQTEEFKKDEVNCSNKRPDGLITMKAFKTINVGFIEVKKQKYRNNDAKTNKDLYKLGVFCKNAIDQNHLLGALGVQVVGTSISFYLTKKQCAGFYIMTEICHLKIPKNLTELPQLIGLVDNLCNLLHDFTTNCQ